MVYISYQRRIKNFKLELTHYGFYENWDPYRNYVLAKEKCGLKEASTLNEGSYTNFAQTDQKIYALHVYFMYLKYGSVEQRKMQVLMLGVVR